MRYVTLLLFLIFQLDALAQVANAEFNNVAKKFEKGSYESVLESAESLIDNDKHRKKPEPYLWASMCYYQIHLSDDEKVKGIDYQFYRDLIAGKYDEEINSGISALRGADLYQGSLIKA